MRSFRACPAASIQWPSASTKRAAPKYAPARAADFVQGACGSLSPATDSRAPMTASARVRAAAARRRSSSKASSFPHSARNFP